MHYLVVFFPGRVAEVIVVERTDGGTMVRSSFLAV